LSVVRNFDDGHAPEFTIRVKNMSEKPVTVHMDSLAPTLLAAKKKSDNLMSPSDGPSSAVVTRQAFWIDAPRMKGLGEREWTVTAPRNFEKDVAIDPKSVFEIRLLFHLPAGEYEFLAGYGGGVHEGQCIASNLIGFDVRDDGTARLVKAAAKTTTGPEAGR
jgi:hypothetical protein